MSAPSPAEELERYWALIRTYDSAIAEVAGYDDPRTACYLARLHARRTEITEQLRELGEGLARERDILRASDGVLHPAAARAESP